MNKQAICSGVSEQKEYKREFDRIMFTSGDVLGATLRYSNRYAERRKTDGVFEQFFWNEQSEYFMNCKGMFNYYSSRDSIIPSHRRMGNEQKYSHSKTT